MRKNSVALLICCNEKDCTVIETNIFYKHFPDTILVSLDVNGEIGWSSTMSDCDISCPDGKGKENRYSTILCHNKQLKNEKILTISQRSTISTHKYQKQNIKSLIIVTMYRDVWTNHVLKPISGI